MSDQLDSLGRSAYQRKVRGSAFSVEAFFRLAGRGALEAVFQTVVIQLGLERLFHRQSTLTYRERLSPDQKRVGPPGFEPGTNRL